MTTEEHCLSPVITEAVSPVPRQIAALRVPGPHTRLIILKQKKIIEKKVFFFIFYLLEPVWIRKGKFGKHPLPLDKIPRGPKNLNLLLEYRTGRNPLFWSIRMPELAWKKNVNKPLSTIPYIYITLIFLKVKQPGELFVSSCSPASP